MQRFFWALFITQLVGTWLPAASQSQSANYRTPMIDTIVIVRQNVFTEQEAQKNFIFRTMNSLRFSTREYVVQRELLFRPGQPYDSARVAESERNLRTLRIFRSVDIDTTNVGSKFAVTVRTRDGWSTKPRFKFAVAADGTVIGTIGVVETNIFGTGNQARLAYDKQVDRDGIQIGAGLKRLFGSHLTARGLYLALSDGKVGDWYLGLPFLAREDRRSIQYGGQAADQRILQFRNEASALDTTTYRRNAFINRVVAATAPTAESRRYLRIGASAEIRQEEYVLRADTGMVIPDTVSLEFGGFAEISRTRFKEVTHFDGFGEQDVNLSTTVRLFANFVPPAFGYNRTGIAPGIIARGAIAFGSGFIRGSLLASGLFNDAALDSGRVVMEMTVANQLARRHTTVLHIEAGILDNPAPGQEFDLGFETPPRNWDPRSFVGTRTLWGSFEHRWFVWDEILNLFALGFAAFVDYGGAWYADQSPRFGGNFGIGLRTGSALSSSPRTGRIDLGFLFGPDVSGDRLTLSFGSGFFF